MIRTVEDVPSPVMSSCATAVRATTSAREALEVATLGGARVLGRPDCGSLQTGKRADIAIWDVSGIEAAGSWDPVASLILCGPTRVRDLFVEGRAVVRGGMVTTIDLPRVITRQNQLARRLI